MGTPESQVTRVIIVSQLLNIRRKDQAVVDFQRVAEYIGSPQDTHCLDILLTEAVSSH